MGIYANLLREKHDKMKNPVNKNQSIYTKELVHSTLLKQQEEALASTILAQDSKCTGEKSMAWLQVTYRQEEGDKIQLKQENKL